MNSPLERFQDLHNKAKKIAEQNRANFPETAKIIDDFRDVFGEDCKLLWAIENGRTLGKVPDETLQEMR